MTTKASGVWADSRLGIIWREGRRPVIKVEMTRRHMNCDSLFDFELCSQPTRAEDGRRRVLSLERLIHGSVATTCSQLRPGDKLLFAESSTAHGNTRTQPLPTLTELRSMVVRMLTCALPGIFDPARQQERLGPGCTVTFDLLRAPDTCHSDCISGNLFYPVSSLHGPTDVRTARFADDASRRAHARANTFTVRLAVGAAAQAAASAFGGALGGDDPGSSS